MIKITDLRTGEVNTYAWTESNIKQCEFLDKRVFKVEIIL